MCILLLGQLIEKRKIGTTYNLEAISVFCLPRIFAHNTTRGILAESHKIWANLENLLESIGILSN